ncbi:MAG: hypothetical protein ACK4N5_13710, partial [Myxococcales bacterium]
DAGQPQGYAAFNPAFPGAFPFRVGRPEHARALMQAIRPHAPADVPHVQVVVENAPELRALLLGAGAELRMEFVHFEGELPPEA